MTKHCRNDSKRMPKRRPSKQLPKRMPKWVPKRMLRNNCRNGSRNGISIEKSRRDQAIGQPRVKSQCPPPVVILLFVFLILGSRHGDHQQRLLVLLAVNEESSRSRFDARGPRKGSERSHFLLRQSRATEEDAHGQSRTMP